jgi:cytochrome P450
VTTASRSDLRYDPYDFEVDRDPYPVWRRLRDERPLYYNEEYDFHALSRFDDVERCFLDWRTYISGKGSVLEAIKSGIEMPPGNILFEDPPAHDLHRGLLSRVLTPRRMLAIEPQVRAFCCTALDPLVAAGRFDFIKDLGAQMPMKTIGMLLGIPTADQEELRVDIDARMKLSEADAVDPVGVATFAADDGSRFGAYIDWRAEHPSDDLMTDLLNAEFEDQDGIRRRLTRDEVLNYVWLNCSGTRHRHQVQARYVTRTVEHHGETVPEGSALLLINGSANRDDRQFPDADRFDIHRSIDHHLAFGFGTHYCLGSHLARLEGRIALEEVLRRFPVWEVDWAGAVPAHTSTVRGWEALPVILPK